MASEAYSRALYLFMFFHNVLLRINSTKLARLFRTVYSTDHINLIQP